MKLKFTKILPLYLVLVTANAHAEEAAAVNDGGKKENRAPSPAAIAAPKLPPAPFWPKSPIPVPQRLSSVAPGKSAPKVTDIWVIFKTHCDLGYTNTADSVNADYRVKMMDNALSMLEIDRQKPKHERFKWTIAGWPMARNILGPLQDPARKAKIEGALREGAFSVHALPATLETDSIDQEELARGFTYSSEISRKYGHPLPIAGKMTDVPAHGWIMPSLLANAGVPFLQIGCNYGVRGPLVPHLFYWESPDGSRILCNYTTAYGSTLLPPKDWPAKNYLAVLMTGDNKGLPSPSEVAAVRAAIAKMPGVTLHFGTMDEFYKAIEAEKPDLPVIQGDMVDSWIHGVSSMPVEAGLARTNSPRTSALGVLDTELRAAGLTTTDLSAPMASVYENAMLFGEHTYGASSQWDGHWKNGVGGYLYGEAWAKARAEGKYKAIEASFDDKRNYIKKAYSIVSQELESRLALLAKSVKMDGERVVVFNALPWSRSGSIEVKPGQFLFAKDVPAGGWKTYPLADVVPAGVEEKMDETVLDTVHFKVVIDLKRGGLASLVDKSTGRELVDTSSPYAFGQFLHEKFSEVQTRDYFNRNATHLASCLAIIKPKMPADAQYGALTPTKWTATVSQDSVVQTIKLTAGDTLGLAKGIAIEFQFSKAEPTLDATVRIIGKTANPIPEGGWLCFPAAASSPRFLLGRAGGLMDLAKDQIVGGNRYLFGVAGGASITSPDGSGLGLCAIDAPCLSFGVPGLWKYDYTYVPQAPVAFVHLYNNKWNTNFPYWIDGDITSRVRLFSVKKADDFVVPSCEARTPLLVATATGAGGDISKEANGISLSRKGVLVTAFGADPDGNEGTLLRVWNQTEEGGNLTITLPHGFKVNKAQPVNFRGEKCGEPIVVTDGSFTFPLGKFAPATFVLENPQD